MKISLSHNIDAEKQELLNSISSENRMTIYLIKVFEAERVLDNPAHKSPLLWSESIEKGISVQELASCVMDNYTKMLTELSESEAQRRDTKRKIQSARSKQDIECIKSCLEI